MLRFVGGATGIALVAGCTEGTGDGNDVSEEHDEDLADIADDPDVPETGWDEGWEDVDTIELEAESDGWLGKRPAAIEGQENPDLALYEGREYEFVWTNGDGDEHNLAIWDDDEAIVSSEFAEDEDETTTLTVEATDEMELFLCETHGNEMAGAIEIRTE
ncbi:cupredoxin domain-containing protein [Natrialbaceae archaeon AArc-T1-2]|uniref:cupredoxin domain-containing protein n=1 Tax=Natrialbaceae archaeon AArc-T1-2 TaxID=3053904 RepID=UPI0031F330F3